MAAYPRVVMAQVSGKRPLVGWLAGIAQPGTAVFVRAFLKGMQELGYTEGQNFDMTYRYADGYVDRLPKLAAELIDANCNVIIAAASAQAVVVKKLTSTIPIVVPAFGDPVALGLIASEARPGSNVTGITPYVKGLPAKQLELARELVPGAVRIGLLDDVGDVKGVPQRREIEAAGLEIGVNIIRAEVRAPDEISSAFQTLSRERADVIIVLQTNMFLGERVQIASLAADKRLPAVYGYGQQVQVGGLISYDVDLVACFHRAAAYVDKILKGAKPGDIPVEFPTKLELIINLKSAKALGLTVPPTLLARADEVIE
jgi:putative ABC transport system substrate-binding protein